MSLGGCSYEFLPSRACSFGNELHDFCGEKGVNPFRRSIVLDVFDRNGDVRRSQP